MNCNQVGQLTEAIVLVEALKHNIVVSYPYGDKARYDMLFDIDGRILKIQVKTSREAKVSGSAFMFNCYSVVNGHKHKYNETEIDYFATVWDNQVYLIPVVECSTEKTLWLSTPNNNKCCVAKKYLLEEVKKDIQAQLK